MTTTRFKRIVLGLPQGMGNQSAVQAAADLAEFMKVDLLAAFVADAALLEMAASPPRRELRLLDQQWQPLDTARMSRDLQDVAELARKRFAESVGNRSIRAAFDVLSDVDRVASLIRAGDIVAIIEPSHPGESITRQFTALLDAAFATAPAVLLMPRRIVRTSGPVMALAGGPDDACIGVALELAATLKERLVVVMPVGAVLPEGILDAAKEFGVPIDPSTGDATASIGSLSLGAASAAKERLRVMSRHLMKDASRVLSMLYGVPLLAIDGDQLQSPAINGDFKASSA
jgi:hypothetical protein